MNESRQKPKDPQGRIVQLTKLLQETEQELQALAGGQLDAVSDATGKPYLLREAQGVLLESERAQRHFAEQQIAILNALPAQIALLDHAGVILSVNDAWLRFGHLNGLGEPKFSTGQNYIRICEAATGECSTEAAAVAQGLREVLEGRRVSFYLEYPCHSPTEKRWFRLVAAPLAENRRAGAVVMHVDITERKLAELERQDLLRDLGERVKELRALHSVASQLQRSDQPTQELLDNVVRSLPDAMQFPESAAARVVFGDLESATPNFAPTPWELRADFSCSDGSSGAIQLVYLAPFPSATIGPFLQEERDLVASIADMLRAHFERLAAERALRSSESRLATAQTIARMGSWENNLATSSAFWTRETHHIFETDPTSFVPSHAAFLDLVHPEDRAAVQTAFTESLNDTSPHTIEHRILLPDGRVKFVEERWQAFPNENGVPQRTVGTSQDITERKLAELRIKETEERYRALFERSLDAVYLHDLEGRFLDANAAALKLLGYDRSEIPNLAIESLLANEEEIAKARRAIKAHLDPNEVPSVTEYRLKSKDGRLIWAELVSGLVYENKKPVAILGIARDVTERKRAEAEAQKTNQTLEAILTSLHGIVAAKLAPLETMNLMATQAQSLTSADAAVIELIEGEDLVYKAVSGKAKENLGLRIPLKSSLSGLAISSEQSLICEDTETDQRVNREACRAVGMRSMIVCPLRDAGNFIGVLKVLAIQPFAFTQGDLKNLQILTESLGVVIQRQRAAEQLRASEAQYRLLFASNPHPMWVYDVQTLRFLMVNDAAKERYGYSEEEFLRMTIRDIRPSEDVPRLESTIAAMSDSRTRNGRWRHLTQDGELVDVEISSDEIVLDGRKARLVLAHDVTERLLAERQLAQANRDLKLLSSCNESLIRATSERDLLQEICHLAVTEGAYRMAWVGYAMDDEERGIAPQAHAGFEDGYFSQVKLSWSENSPAGNGPAGKTIRTGTIQFCEDLENDPSFAPWRDPALRRGYKAVVCLPLMDGEKAFGLLCLYASERKPSSTEETKILGELAADLAFGILNLRSRNERQRLEAAVIKVGAGVSAATGMAFFAQLAASMTEALDAQLGVVAQLLPGEPKLARTIATVVGGEVVGDFDLPLSGNPCEALLSHEICVMHRKHGDPSPLPPHLDNIQAHCLVGKRLDNSDGVPVGVLFVAFGQPVRHTDFITSTLRIFAARAASELDRQRTDDRLREQAALLDTAREAIQVRDLNDTIIYWNKGAELTYGWSATEAIGKKSKELFQQEEKSFQEAIAKLMQQGEWRGEMEKRDKQGARLTTEVGWTLVRGTDGAPKSILAIDTDITEKKKLEARFLRAQRMESIGTLAGGIAHDLNNVLAPIMMSIELLQDFVTDPVGLAMLSTIQSSAQRGSDLVKQVLSFARGVERQRALVDLSHLVRDIEKVIRDTFPKNVGFKLQRPSSLWTIEGDPTQIYQVVMNLCVNARDAMPEGGNLCVALSNEDLDETYATMHPESRSGAYVQVAVSDTGTGIPKEIQEKIFEPFFTTKETGKGTGLGLSTSLAIVKSHAGFIMLESQQGKGTCFRVYFPANKVGQAQKDESSQTPNLPRGNGQLVLVVDDEEAIREIVRGTLERFGYRVKLATQGAEAVAIYAVQGKEIAAVLTDMAMPVMDGPALIAALKTINPKVRIVGSSGLSSSESVARLSGVGIEHFIPKPYTAEAILKVLHKVINAPS